MGKRLPQWLLNAPEKSWHKLNTNTHEDVYSGLDDCAIATSFGPFRRVWEAFAGSSWDTKRKVVWIFGGGHAVTTYNSPVAFEVGSAVWSALHIQTSSIDTDFENDVSGSRYVTADYAFNYQGAPVSAHAYDTNKYLPVLDRHITFAASQAGDGSWWRKFLDQQGNQVEGWPDADRTGPYLYDYGKRDLTKVGGNTGTAINPSGCNNENVAGAQAWENRDWMESFLPSGWSSNNLSVVSRVEDGVDVCYVSRTSLRRIELHPDPANDVPQVAGTFSTNFPGQHAACICPVGDREIYLQFAGRHPSASGGIIWFAVYFDITDLPTTYGNTRIPVDDVTPIESLHYTTGDGDFPEDDWFDGPHADEEGGSPGIVYDPVRDKVVIWNGSKRLYEFKRPLSLESDDWGIVDYVTDPVSTHNPTNPGEGGLTRSILGHFHYDREWDVYIGIEGISSDVWMFKPENWSPEAQPVTEITGLIWQDQLGSPDGLLWLSQLKMPTVPEIQGLVWQDQLGSPDGLIWQKHLDIDGPG